MISGTCRDGQRGQDIQLEFATTRSVGTWCLNWLPSSFLHFPLPKEL